MKLLLTAAVLAAATTFVLGWIIARMQRAAEPSWRDALEVEPV